MNKATDASGGAGLIISGTALVSLAWLAFLCWLFIHSAKCPDVLPEATLMASWVECRPSNEIGDFLAGAFAPLAFIWLAAAVIIQSTELRLQREELGLARAEAGETREAIKAQAQEAKKQAEYIGAQTKLLQEAERARVDERRVREFNALIEKLAGRIKDNKHATLAQGRLRDDGFALQQQATFSLYRDNRWDDIDSSFEIVRTVVAMSRESLITFLSPITRADGPWNSVYPERLDTVLSAVRECRSVVSSLPLEARTRAEALNLQEFLDTLESYKAHLSVTATEV